MIVMLFNKIKRRLFYTFASSRRTPEVVKIEKIAVLAKVPKDSKKFDHWHDGFVAAVSLLKQDFKTVDIIFYNTVAKERWIEVFNSYDFLIVKSGWYSDIDYFLRRNSKDLSSKMGLMISASLHAPSKRIQDFYDVLWYETDWYRAFAVRHTNAHHAFGVDKSIMKRKRAEKVYDYICVGAPKAYKRIHLLVHKPGKKLFIGDLTNQDEQSRKLLRLLQSHDVEIVDFCTYSELADYYNQSRKCFVPCMLHGGGERSVLEARSCGLEVEIETDNPKLVELQHGKVWDQQYYYLQLLKGVNSTL